MDRAGRIYVIDALNHRIVRVNDITGASWTTLGSLGRGVNQFHLEGLSGIFVDRAGQISVGDFFNNRIVRMNDMTGTGWTTLGSLGTGINQFSNPAGVFVDGADRIYVADFFNNRMDRPDPPLGWDGPLFPRATTISSAERPHPCNERGRHVDITEEDSLPRGAKGRDILPMGPTVGCAQQCVRSRLAGRGHGPASPSIDHMD